MMRNRSIWRLVYTKPRQEVEAQLQLERQGYTTYLPMLCRQERRRGKLQDIMTPLFPRYLFVQLTTGIDDWGPIRSTRGVSNIVKFGIETACIPSSLIDEIRSREGVDGCYHPIKQTFEQGDKVRISEGPFTGYDAIFQARNSEDRVYILLDIVGRETRIQISTESLERL